MYTPLQLSIIQKAVEDSAEQARSDAGYGGHHHDGGARASLEKWTTWLDGYNSGVHGTDSTIYHSIIDKVERESAPEYQLYLKLKEKFEDK